MKKAQSFAHELRADSATLMWGQHGNRSESEPTRCAIRDRYRRYRNVSDDDAVCVGDE